ncbi:MAG TPA: hypothetical protein DF699_16810, partial [Phycisphaerales bacterium]|nr:hypothetical protein [Phycisphaerales bacterium]
MLAFGGVQAFGDAMVHSRNALRGVPAWRKPLPDCVLCCRLMTSATRSRHGEVKSSGRVLSASDIEKL